MTNEPITLSVTRLFRLLESTEHLAEIARKIEVALTDEAICNYLQVCIEADGRDEEEVRVLRDAIFVLHNTYVPEEPPRPRDEP